MELEGIIIMDLPLEEGVSQRTGNPWKKKSWVLETLGNYPRKVKFDIFGDRVGTMNFELGKCYVVSVDAESREFNGRWYTDLRAFNSRPSENMGPQGVPNQFGQPGPQFGQQAPQQQFGQTPAGPQFGQQTAQDTSQGPLPAADPTEDLPF